MRELSAQPSRGGFDFLYKIVIQACQMSGRALKPDGQCSTTHTREHEEELVWSARQPWVQPWTAPNPQLRADGGLEERLQANLQRGGGGGVYP